MTPATHAAVLTGTGRIPWQRARALLGGATCAWADLDGLHTAPAPEHAPLTGHLWAWWPDGRCARLRLDEDDVYAALLHPADTDTPDPGPAPGAPPAETVTVHRHPGAHLWALSDRQAGPLPEAVRAWTYDLLEVTGPHPTTFVHGRPAPTTPGSGR